MCELHVEDMSCQHCVGHITKALEGAGITGFSVSLENKTVTVEESQAEKAKSVLEEAGYPAV